MQIPRIVIWAVLVACDSLVGAQANQRALDRGCHAEVVTAPMTGGRRLLVASVVMVGLVGAGGCDRGASGPSPSSITMTAPSITMTAPEAVKAFETIFV
jgi:hypothetical protein